MSLVVDRRPTSSAPADRRRAGEALATGLLVDRMCGTSAGVRFRDFQGDARRVTSVPSIGPAQPRSRTVAEEVRHHRDSIAAAGVTRQQLAQLLGVDRRSVSGWVSGDARPGPERLAALRAVAAVICRIHVEMPGRVPEVLALRRGASTLLDATTAGLAKLESWRSWLGRAETTPSVAPRPGAGEPLWAAAARALGEGRLATPPRRPVIRKPDVYETDPNTGAELFAEPDHQSGRRGYR